MVSDWAFIVSADIGVGADAHALLEIRTAEQSLERLQGQAPSCNRIARRGTGLPDQGADSIPVPTMSGRVAQCVMKRFQFKAALGDAGSESAPSSEVSL